MVDRMTKRKPIPECCRIELSWTEYAKDPQIIRGEAYPVITKSTSIYRCARCDRLIGSCMCDHDYGAPLILFLNEGEKGMVVFCVDCFNELGLMPQEVKAEDGC